MQILQRVRESATSLLAIQDFMLTSLGKTGMDTSFQLRAFGERESRGV
jgi:hypothetical protein